MSKPKKAGPGMGQVTPPATAPRGPLPAGVKQTSGGKFDPDAGLTYFIAGSAQALQESNHQHVLIAVNEVRTAKDHDLLDRLCDERTVMLDSGIFALANAHAKAHGVSHDVGLSMPPEQIDGFQELWDRYGSVATRYADRLWGVVELDQGGVANKPRTRARIEAEFGLTPIPVYHPLLDGWDYWNTLADGYDRLCYGNLVKASPPVRLRLIHTASERARTRPWLWQHFLGVTPNENLLAMPYRGSCDSSSWVTNLRWMPSWKDWSMLRMVTGFPTTMWYGEGQHEKARRMAGFMADATQRTIDAVREDTHPWL